jgi:hypothetical protein
MKEEKKKLQTKKAKKLLVGMANLSSHVLLCVIATKNKRKI